MGAQEVRIGRLNYCVNGKRSGNHGEDVFCSTFDDIENVSFKKWRHLDILLISIPTTYHYEALLDGMYKYGFDYRGKTKIIIGGYAAINPFLLLGYFDLWVWGRAKNVSSDIIEAVIENKILTYAATPDEILSGEKKNIRQEPLYNDETFTGCPYKCKFCQYAHIRKYQKSNGSGYSQNTLAGRKSPEIMLKDIIKMNEKPGRLRAGLDGSSEKIRYIYGKRISNQNIIDAIQHLGDLAKNKTAIVLTLYTICNFPNETSDDTAELESVFKNMAEPSGRVIVVLCGLGFRPMPLTPMQYEPAGVFPSIVPMRQKVIRDTNNLRVTWSYTLEGPLSTLRNVIVERCDIENLNNIRSAILKNVNVDSELSAKSMIRSFDLKKIIGKRESLPTDFIRA